jgi:hypothetical protein
LPFAGPHFSISAGTVVATTFLVVVEVVLTVVLVVLLVEVV